MPSTLTENEYDRGDRIKLSITIRDVEDSNALIDPDSLLFTLKEPDGATTSYVYLADVQVVRDSLGVYHVSWDAVKPGQHWARFVASGNVGAAEELGFRVRQSRVIA